MEEKVSGLENRIRNRKGNLRDDEQARLEGQGELMTRQFQRKQDDLNEAVNAAQSDVIDNIGRKMLDVLDRYARENGYTAVFATSPQGSPDVYGSSQAAITDE